MRQNRELFSCCCRQIHSQVESARKGHVQLRSIRRITTKTHAKHPNEMKTNNELNVHSKETHKTPAEMKRNKQSSKLNERKWSRQIENYAIANMFARIFQPCHLRPFKKLSENVQSRTIKIGKNYNSLCALVYCRYSLGLWLLWRLFTLQLPCSKYSQSLRHFYLVSNNSTQPSFLHSSGVRSQDEFSNQSRKKLTKVFFVSCRFCRQWKSWMGIFAESRNDTIGMQFIKMQTLRAHLLLQ